MPTDFIAVGDLATFMGTTAGALNAALASLAVAAAQASVREYLSQEITFHQDDEVLLDGTGTKRLRLPERPVRLVVSVTEDDELVDADDYVLRDSILIRTDGGVWSCAELANIEVVYSHGWDTGEIDTNLSDSDFDALHIPADIILATLSAARRAYQSMGEDPEQELRGETIGAYSYTLLQPATGQSTGGVNLHAAEQRVLDRYLFRGSG